MKALVVDIISPEGVIYSGSADLVIVPGVEGELGFLPGHQPLLTMMREGAVRVSGSDCGDLWVRVVSGYVSVNADHVVVLPNHFAEAERLSS